MNTPVPSLDMMRARCAPINQVRIFVTDKEFVCAQVNVTPMILPTQNRACRTLLRSAERSVESL